AAASCRLLGPAASPAVPPAHGPARAAGLPAARAPARGAPCRRASPRPASAAGNGSARPGNRPATPTPALAARPSWRLPRPVPEQHIQALGPVTRRRGRPDPLPGLTDLLAMVGQYPADHVLLARRQIQLRGRQQRMA